MRGDHVSDRGSWGSAPTDRCQGLDNKRGNDIQDHEYQGMNLNNTARSQSGGPGSGSNEKPENCEMDCSFDDNVHNPTSHLLNLPRELRDEVC